MNGVPDRQALDRALHELRRPLQALALGLGGGGGPAAGGRLAGRLAGQIELAALALADLERALDGFGMAPVVRRRLDCVTLAAEAADRWWPVAAAAGGDVELEWEGGEAPVLAEPARIAQALDNLIANAIEHGGARVRIAGATGEARVRMTVRDGGELAPAPRLPRELAPVPRLPRGAGLVPRFPRGQGLRIVSAIARAHGGRFAIHHSRRGTAAAIELPLAVRASAPRAA